MLYSLRWIIVACFIVVQLAGRTDAASATYQWNQERNLSGYLPESGYLFETPVRSSIECAQFCSGNVGCLSFFYIASRQLCQTHGTVYTTTAGMVTDNGSKYYLQSSTGSSLQPVMPTTTLETTSQLGACPIDGSYKTVALSKTNSITFRIVPENNVQRQTAIAGCQEDGATLVAVTTEIKMKYLIKVIVGCAAYNLSDYWVDGSNEATGDWVLSDGTTPVPMEHGMFWVNGKPNNPTSTHCLRMKRDRDYLWDDCDCNDAQWAYICEK